MKLTTAQLVVLEEIVFLYSLFSWYPVDFAVIVFVHISRGLILLASHTVETLVYPFVDVATRPYRRENRLHEGLMPGLRGAHKGRWPAGV